MMFTSLDASSYSHSNTFYNSEFEVILSKIIICYNLMLTDKVILKNDENIIRDSLLINYLKNNEVRKKIELTDYLFDREVPEDTTVGRTDIKIQTLDTFKDTAAYYTIECKRLDSTNLEGTTGLNGKYIQNGICRFASKTYSAHYKTNGMIGFIVETLDIQTNISSINKLLEASFKDANTTRALFSKNISTGFDFSYCSTHTIEANEIVIYHLMFDFSKNIKS